MNSGLISRPFTTSLAGAGFAIAIYVGNQANKFRFHSNQLQVQENDILITLEQSAIQQVYDPPATQYDWATEDLDLPIDYGNSQNTPLIQPEFESI